MGTGPLSPSIPPGAMTRGSTPGRGKSGPHMMSNGGNEVGMAKIKVKTPVVELDGDQTTRII
jgi:hypothetical protein